LVHPSANQYRAFSAVCTHAGCTVRLDSSAAQFVCPCHGSSFSTTSGAVLSGPAPSALPSIPLQVANGEVHRSDTG
jgi:thiosulfate dehydrogenase [quinone] large subunit